MPIFGFHIRQEKIYTLLEELAGAMCEASLLTKEIISDGALPDYYFDLMQAIRNRGNRILNQVWKETSCQFVLPFDPEDITALARQLNKALDMIVLIALKISFYQAAAGKEKELLNMLVILGNTTAEVYQLITSLPNLKTKGRQLSNKCEVISAGREQSQLYYLQGTSCLYRQKNLPPSEMLLLQEIYMAAAGALDSCYELIYTVREMTIKYV